MASIIESEEELACLNREVDEEMDQITNTCSWILAQNCLKPTINNVVALGDLELLKMLDSESFILKSNSLVAMASALGNGTSSTNLINMREQIASSGKELENLIVQMRSGTLEGEVEEYREKIREIRAKKHSILHEMNERQQSVNAEELSIAGFIDLLKEINRDIETTIHCHGQELQKLENIFNDVAFGSPLFGDVCE
ncbi:uncharacterized protein LOC126565504 [Anopheles maculipalpis]|uniref:uncharacterized protein LOC126565504 n=1 Tax=Anopheles maculipalpis TaxID=1496333 RepID=UPI0021595DF1|nr:uncharacterized protein LOC126565504 [Anopheles maculipalpis]